MHHSEPTMPSDEKPIELDEQMLRGQEFLMKSGLKASQAKHPVEVEDADKPPINSLQSWMRKAPFVALGLAPEAKQPLIIPGTLT